MGKEDQGPSLLFGRGDDPEGALAEYDEHKDAMQNGRDTRRVVATGAFTLHQACNVFMAVRQLERRKANLATIKDKHERRAEEIAIKELEAQLERSAKALDSAVQHVAQNT